ncbi:MAG: CDP-alcohol phosphatidyltransferase family protein [Acidimicrobiales bacterium]|jgi:CDP-diacylglycerol--serine O-phosphatidyltransferase
MPNARSAPLPTKPPIVMSLRDAANLLTLAGLCSSVLAITFAVTGRLSAAAVALVAAFVFDVVDGPVAKRLSGRNEDDRAIGANLDSLADVVSAGVAVGVVFLAYADFEAAFLPGAFLLAGAATLRLAYFNVHGLGETSTTYTGLPTDLAIIAFVAVLLLDQPLSRGAFQVVLYAAVIVLVSLMVSSLRVPKLVGTGFYLVLGLAVFLAAVHSAIAFS